MSIEGRIDTLIEVGWDVLDSDFNPVALQRWRRRAAGCLIAVVGPDQTYTRRFDSFFAKAGKRNFLPPAAY